MLTWRTTAIISARYGHSPILFRLSAYLYDVTGNDTFADAASDAHAFTQAHLYNSTGGYIMDGCAGGPVVTYDTGLYLEALSVLANSTKNSTLMQM